MKQVDTAPRVAQILRIGRGDFWTACLPAHDPLQSPQVRRLRGRDL
jgi:hypothetical protein